ncbi:MAG: molybdate ABC transporter substrate-binding protein [Lachnospiraceae bacterium]|nr:molybdate ABC transporter substrate-binding protein [Lachnospiraceae bacterium]
MKGRTIVSLCLVFVLLCTLAGCSYAVPAPQAQDQEEPAQAEPAAQPEEADAQPEEAVTDAGETQNAEEPVELIVFAAASMTETLTEIAENYKAVAPNVSPVFNFDSSGTLKTQIQEGADVDVFISAAPKQMNQLDSSKDAEANPDGLDFVQQGSRIDLLENKVVLAVPESNPKGINSYDALADGLKDGSVFLAMGNSDVPVGQYTQKILDYYGLNEDELAAKGCITYGSNVKEVTTQVSEAAVDCGIIYATDAFSAGLEFVDTATPEMCGQVIYPAAVMNVSKNPKAAQAFLDYLTGPEASEVFESVGFTTLF